MFGVFIPRSGPEDHVKMLTAFADGLKACGEPHERHVLEDGYKPCDVAVVFGVYKAAVPVSFPRGQVFEAQRSQGRTVVVLERGYVRRNEYYCAGLNGLNGRADHRNNHSPSFRWELLGAKLKPWRASAPTDPVVVCGQVPWDATVQHTDHVAWCQETVRHVKSCTTRPVLFRPHPLAPIDYGVDCEISRFSKLDEAHALITFNSTTGALTVIDGVPVYAHDHGSMAWPVAFRRLVDIDNPPKPDREQWAYNLAYAQWTEAEMRAGQTFNHLFGDPA